MQYYNEDQDKLDNIVRWTITLPIALSISVDIERKNSKDSKSSWIKSAIEEKLKRIKEEEEAKNEIKTLREEVSLLKDLLLEIKDKIK